MKKPIETPMYFAKGFIEGAEKRFPEVDGDIAKAKRRTTDFLKATGEKIKKLEEVRKANYADPTQSDEAKAVNTWEYAKRKHDEVQKLAETLPDLSQFSDGIQKKINNEMQQVADSDFGREARQRISEMTEKERATFISGRMNNGDYDTPVFALGAPAYLSGLPDQVHAKFKKKYVSDFYPAELNLMESLNSLHDHTQKGLKEYNKLMRKLRADASINGALDKAERAKELMSK